MIIIGFGHQKHVGKTLAAFLLEENLRLNHPTLRIKCTTFASPIYRICNHVFGWDGFQSEKYYIDHPETKSIPLPTIGKSPRQILIEVGTMCFRNIVYERTWVDFLVFNNPEVDVLIVSDLRFPNEFSAIKEAGGSCIKIVRNTGADVSDVADQALVGEDSWDATIHNYGTKRDLNDMVMKVWEHLHGHTFRST